MKVKPYRICDICKEQYTKRSGCMRITRLEFPSWADDDLHFFERMDICPSCADMLIEVVRMAKEDINGSRSICTD